MTSIASHKGNTRHVGLVHPREAGDGKVSTLLLMLVLSLLIFGAIIFGFYLKDIYRQPGFIIDIFPRNERNFTIGKVALGTYLDALRKRHPNAEVAIDARGNPTLAYQSEDAVYTVWFTNNLNTMQAYRIRHDQGFSGYLANDILASLVKRFGKIATSECTKSTISNTSECRFRWIMDDTLVLDVTLREAQTARGTAKTHMTSQVVNTYVEGKVLRD